MEQKFIVRHPVTFELYKEWAKNPLSSSAIEKRKRRIFINVAGCIICALVIALGASTGKPDRMLIGEVLLALCLISLFFMPNREIKKGYESALKVLGDSQWMRTITFSDNLTVEDGRTNIRFEYSEISRITEDDKHFNLFINADMAFRVPKDSFTTGSPDGFRKFINNTVTSKSEEIETAEEDLGL